MAASGRGAGEARAAQVRRGATAGALAALAAALLLLAYVWSGGEAYLPSLVSASGAVEVHHFGEPGAENAVVVDPQGVLEEEDAPPAPELDDAAGLLDTVVGADDEKVDAPPEPSQPPAPKAPPRAKGPKPAKPVEFPASMAEALVADERGLPPRPRWCGGAPNSVLPWKPRSMTATGAAQLAATQAEQMRYANGTAVFPEGQRRRLLAEEDEEGGGCGAGAGGGRRLAGMATGYYGCGKKRMRIQTENDGRGPLGKPVSGREAKQRGFGAIVKCIKNTDFCGLDAMHAASNLPGMRLLMSQERAKLGVHGNYRSCALVGNAGHMIKKKYGQYIDNHDAVVRFNAMTLSAGVRPNVGTKTTLRFMNHQRSRNVCCGDRGMPDKGGGGVSIVLWHPGMQHEVQKMCRKKFPNSKVYALSKQFISKEVQAMKQLRKDMSQMGQMRFSTWMQLTSGGHAILLMARLCDQISLYGFTTYPSSTRDPDQYGGRPKKSRSGNLWHDWGGEALVWRVLHASGKMTICSG